jgi:pimeloyl-ACP methyl ester carboxylesterase
MISWTAMSTGATEDQGRPAEPRRNRFGIGTIVVLSLGVGLAAAVLLPFMIPWPTVDANFATAMVLLGFAVGWALLAFLSGRLADQPQKWAYAPAAFMGVSAVLLLFLPDAVLDALDWLWPPALVVLAAWVYRRAKRDLRSRVRTWLLNPVLAVLVLFALGGAFQTIGRAMDPGVAMRGELVDVGPYRLHLECSGMGAPTVVVEPGGGASSATLGLIAPEVARHTTVCIYDRAGKGWSDAAQTAPDGTQIATDLHTLLERADVPGPYVLAGHSFGGLYVMRYAAQYPDEVAGMVLIDSTTPNTNPIPLNDQGSDTFLKHFSALVSATARLGMGRLLGASAMEMASFIDEYVTANRSASEVGALTSLGGKPLIILTAKEGNAPGWIEKQAALAALSSNSLHNVMPAATHQSLGDNRAHAALVSQAIVDVVESIRTGAPLATQ